jgi:peroxiredoxin
MDQHAALAVGDRMPDLSLPTLSGGTFNLRDCRDKKYILYMWASW